MSAEEFQHQLGDRLRAIRNQQGLTLQEVEERSAGEWKAVVVGSYERGDRAVSVAKLSRLAEFYGVPMADLLPNSPDTPDSVASESESKITIDLSRLSDLVELDGTLEPLHRYAYRIQVERGDYNGRVLSLRTDDLRALAVAFTDGPEAFLERLSDDHILVAH